MRIRELPTKLAALALLTATLLLALVACKPSAGDGGLPRSETLYLAGWQWGEPSSFNPLLTTVEGCFDRWKRSNPVLRRLCGII